MNKKYILWNYKAICMDYVECFELDQYVDGDYNLLIHTSRETIETEFISINTINDDPEMFMSFFIRNLSYEHKLNDSIGICEIVQYTISFMEDIAREGIEYKEYKKRDE